MPPDAAHLAQLSRLLDEALDLPPPEFERWLGELPEDNPIVRNKF
jgi:hypothetical protein